MYILNVIDDCLPYFSCACSLCSKRHLLYILYSMHILTTHKHACTHTHTQTSPSNRNNYGERLMAFFNPHASGLHTFFESSDNEGELWMAQGHNITETERFVTAQLELVRSLFQPHPCLKIDCEPLLFLTSEPY